MDSIELIHLDPDFIKQDGEVRWEELFRRVELLDRFQQEPDEEVAAVLAIAGEASEPAREPGGFCKRPQICRFRDHCTASKNAAWYVNGMRSSARRKARILEAVASGKAWYSDDLGSKLSSIFPPIWSLDFEAVAPAVPLFAGTRPYQALVFQWSLHRLEIGGEIEHLEFLADGDSDPRTEVARSLVEALGGDDAPILVYSAYEKRCLRELAETYPEHGEALDAISKRLVDMLTIVRSSFYHPDLRGSFSIKKVAPILAPQVTYDDLDEVSNGTAAMAAFIRIVRSEVRPEEMTLLRKRLLAYCKRDTLAVIEVYRALCRIAGKHV